MNVSMQIKRPPNGSTFESFSTVLALSQDDVPELVSVRTDVAILVLQLYVWKHVLISAVMNGSMTSTEFANRYTDALTAVRILLPEDFTYLLDVLHLDVDFN